MIRAKLTITQPPAPPAPDVGKITGTVTHETVGVGNVLVQAVWRVAYEDWLIEGETTTDDNGSFILADIPRGTYELRVYHPD